MSHFLNAFAQKRAIHNRVSHDVADCVVDREALFRLCQQRREKRRRTTICRFFFFFEVVVFFFVFLFSSEEAMRRALESLVVETILAGKGRTFRSTSRRRTHRDSKQKPFGADDDEIHLHPNANDAESILADVSSRETGAAIVRRRRKRRRKQQQQQRKN